MRLLTQLPCGKPNRREPPRESVGLAGALLVSALLLGTPALGAPTSPSTRSTEQSAEDEQPCTTGLDRVLEELEKARRIDTESLATALLISGPRGPGELFAALDQPSAVDPFDGESVEASRIDDLKRERLERALATLPRWVLERRRRGDVTPRRMALEAKLAIAVIENRGDRQSLAIAIELVTPEDPTERPDRHLAAGFERAVSRLLQRDPEAISRIEDDFQKIPRALMPTMLRAVGAAPSSSALSFLGERLDEAPELELIVLAQIGRVAAALRTPCAERVQTAVLMHLMSADPALRREACLTAGRMECLNAVSDLIDLLRDKDGGVRSNAHWALERLTGKSLAAEPDRWRTWYWNETRWWQEEAPALIDQVRSDDPTQISAAMRKFSSHKLHRHELAKELVSLLDYENDSVVRQACAALGVLRSSVAVPGLAKALDHPTAEVRQGAHQALKTITERHDLPAEREAWAQPWTRSNPPTH